MKKTDSMMIRMIIFVILIVMLTTLVLTISGSIIYSKSILKQMYEGISQVQAQVQKSTDDKIISVSNSIELLEGNNKIYEYLRLDENAKPQERLSLESELRNLLLLYRNTYSEYLSIVIASKYGQYISNESYRIERISLSEEKWYKKAITTYNKAAIIGPIIGRNLNSWRNYSADSYISIAKAIIDPNSKEELGVILIDLDIKNLKENMQSISSFGTVFVMDSEGNILYSPENDIVYRVKPEWFSKSPNGNIKALIMGKIYNIIYTKSKLSGLTTVSIYGEETTVAEVSTIQITYLLLSLITLIVGFIWAIAISASFTKPLRELTTLMKQARNGNFSVRYDKKCKGEVRELGNSFNIMIDRIKELIAMVYKEQNDKREAEMRILQEQIKPHFLYNTLDTIQWMARKKGANDIVDMVLSLSHFFRISLNSGKEILSVQDELTMIKSYLDVQKYRYKDMFDYKIEVDDTIKKCKMMKLTLQPIVENALYHGIKESDNEQGFIWIRASKKDDDKILIIVEDDGAGMNDDKLNDINHLLKSKERPENVKGYGILNVNDRIRISYGEEYGLSYSKRLGGGTKVEILIKNTEVKYVENINS